MNPLWRSGGCSSRTFRRLRCRRFQDRIRRLCHLSPIRVPPLRAIYSDGPADARTSIDRFPCLEREDRQDSVLNPLSAPLSSGFWARLSGLNLLNYFNPCNYSGTQTRRISQDSITRWTGYGASTKTSISNAVPLPFTIRRVCRCIQAACGVPIYPVAQ